MQTYVNCDLQEGSKINELPIIHNKRFKINQKIFPTKEVLRDEMYTPIGSSVRYLSIDQALSQSIGGLK